MRSLTRATRLACASAPFNPINARCTSARYRLLALRHEGRSLIRRSRFCTTCADSSAQHLFFACRNRSAQLHFVPPASCRLPFSYDCTSHLAFKTGSKPTACAGSSAQHALRALARLQPNPRELHSSSLPIACPEARRAQPHSSLSILYNLRSTTRATPLLCVPQPRRAIALRTASLRPAPFGLRFSVGARPCRARSR